MNIWKHKLISSKNLYILKGPIASYAMGTGSSFIKDKLAKAWHRTFTCI
jgi:hypothetical protein